MALWHRIGKSKLKSACIQFRRCYYIHLPHANSTTPKPLLHPTEEIPHHHPYSSFFHGSRPLTRVCNSVRFFAAPVQFQAKPKYEDDDTDGPRLNDQIKAKFIRLVREDGEHSIVSTFEALERARNLKLDLVEVQKDGKPPVCKIMDYHKEMYKRQEKDKERAKSKSDMTLRKECKEVRFSVKTESKDLKMKADMVKKLMDKGYRVKCKATGNEDQNMIESVSRLLALIEDVCVVESGPHLTRKEAYMIVRHVRFGPAKKGAKKLQDASHTVDVKAEEGDVEPLTASSSDSIEYEHRSSAESWFETKGEEASDFDKQFSHLVDESDKSVNDGNDSVSPAMLENRYKKRAADENKVRNNAQVPPAVTENRYRRAEPRNRFQQAPPNTDPGIRDVRTPSNLNRTRHAPIENTRQAFNTPPGSRNSMPLRDDMPNHPRALNTTNPGYGHFNNPRGPPTAGMHRTREGNSVDFTRQPFGRESR